MLAVGTDGEVVFSHTHDQATRWNLMDSGDAQEGIYIQSASRVTSSFLFSADAGVTTHGVPETWKIEPAGNGTVKLRSVALSNYLQDNAGTLMLATDEIAADSKQKVQNHAYRSGMGPIAFNARLGSICPRTHHRQ